MDDFKFRYSLDLGAGYVLVDVYENTLKLDVRKSRNKSFKIQELSGGISFVGQTASDAYSKRFTSYFVPFKIEEWNGLIWQTLHECNVSLKGRYERLSLVLEASEFKELLTPESNILSNLTTTYKTNNINGLITSPVTVLYQSTLLTVTTAETLLNKNDYKLAFDIQGNAVTTFDTRWDYFDWQASFPLGGGEVHTYDTLRFLSRPSRNGTTNGYDRVFYFDVENWFKLPPSFPAVTENWNDLVLGNGYKVRDVLNKIVFGLDNTLSFDAADADTPNFDPLNTYLGDGNEYEPANIEGINFTLALLFDYWLNYYNNGWYVDGAKLKFRNDPYKYFNSSLNWAAETANINIIQLIENIPDLEVWKFGDDSLDRQLISYYDKGVLTDQKTNDYSIDIMHDIPTLRNGGISRGKLIWLHDSGGSPIIDTPASLYESFGKYRGFSEFAPQAVSTDPNDPYVPIIGFENRPIYEMMHNKWINDYVAFDLFSKITVDGGNVGYLDSYVIDLETGDAEFKILFDTFTT